MNGNGISSDIKKLFVSVWKNYSGSIPEKETAIASEADSCKQQSRVRCWRQSSLDLDGRQTMGTILLLLLQYLEIGADLHVNSSLNIGFKSPMPCSVRNDHIQQMFRNLTQWIATVNSPKPRQLVCLCPFVRTIRWLFPSSVLFHSLKMTLPFPSD